MLVYYKCYEAVCPCLINAAEQRKKKRMTEALGRVKRALHAIQEKCGGYIPRSVFSEAMKKMGHKEYAKEQQGQYYYVLPNHRYLNHEVNYLWPNTAPLGHMQDLRKELGSS